MDGSELDMDDNAGEGDSLEIIFKEIKDRLDKQFEQIETLTTRSAYLMGFASLVLASLITIRKNMGELDKYKVIALALAGAIYTMVLIFSFLSYRLRDYRRDPEPEPLRNNYIDRPSRETKRQLVSNFIDSIGHNKKIIMDRILYLKVAIIFLFILIAYLLFLLIIISPQPDHLNIAPWHHGR